jgi:hypothetical protein
MRTLAITIAFAGSVCVVSAAPLNAQEIDAGRVRSAVERALPPIQASLKAFETGKNESLAKGPPGLPEAYRKAGCISCHHEGLGLTTLSFLRTRGFAIDERLARHEAEVLKKAYGEFAPLYRRACTDEDAARQADFFEDIAVQMGYMLGGLLDSGHGRDADTDAAATLLMKFQQDDGSWTYTTAREPMQSSDFTTTAMAARVLQAYAPEDQKGRADEAVARARRWLLDNSPETTDDLAFRLLGLKWLGGEDDDIRGATAALRAVQREDGGWAQLPTAKSDAYATGIALFALNQGGGVAVDDAAYRRGVAFLLETQAEDGTWFVRKWAYGYNTYFDAGFPYGKSQFISLAGTCWASMALSLAVDPSPGAAR